MNEDEKDLETYLKIVGTKVKEKIEEEVRSHASIKVNMLVYLEFVLPRFVDGEVEERLTVYFKTKNISFFGLTFGENVIIQ